MEPSVLTLIASLIIAGIIYRWKKRAWDIEQKLKWVPKVHGLPLLGNVLEFSKSTEFLNVLMKYTVKHNGLCQISLTTEKFLVVSDHKVLEYFLTTRDVLNKAASYKFLQNWLGQGLILADGVKARATRKFLTPTFNFKILEEFVDVFESNGDILVDKLHSNLGRIIDIYPFITMCTLDIICESTMGVSVNAQTNDQSDYVKAVKEMCRIEVDRTFSPFKMYDWLYPLSKDYYKEKRYVKILHDQTDFVIMTRKKELTERAYVNPHKDEPEGKPKMAFLDLMLQATVDGKRLTDQEIRQEVDTFMFAGHDTTSSAIGFTLYCLATHPRVQRQAIAEQQIVFDRQIRKTATYAQLQSMTYLEKVIKEALRLYPSVPFVGRLTDKEVQFQAGKRIPKDIGIILFLFGANRNPESFPDPEKFDPTRFDEENRRYTPYSYVPFSAGPRNCIGQKFAMLVMKSVISKILRHYQLFPCGEAPILAAETVLKSANGIKLKLVNRDLV